jgi:hypothetical protein
MRVDLNKDEAEKWTHLLLPGGQLLRNLALLRRRILGQWLGIDGERVEGKV